MQDLFNRGLCKALESAAIAELEQRLRHAQRLRTVCEVAGTLRTLYIYKGDMLLTVGVQLTDEAWRYDRYEYAEHGLGSEHRLLGSSAPYSMPVACVVLDDRMVPPLRGLLNVEINGPPHILLSRADLAVFLRDLFQLVETQCADAVRQGNLAAVRQLAAALNIGLE
jgi:hypothetical protein